MQVKKSQMMTTTTMMMKKSKKMMMMMTMMMMQVKPVEEDRRPSAVYLNVIVRGAKENGLPKVITINIIIVILKMCIIYCCEILLFEGVHREARINWAQWVSRRGGGDHRPQRENQNSWLKHLYFVIFIFYGTFPRVIYDKWIHIEKNPIVVTPPAIAMVSNVNFVLISPSSFWSFPIDQVHVSLGFSEYWIWLYEEGRWFLATTG